MVILLVRRRFLIKRAGKCLPPGCGSRAASLKAEFSILYFVDDSTRQALALAVADMLRPLDILATPLGKSEAEVKRLAPSNVVLYGGGSHNPVRAYYY